MHTITWSTPTGQRTTPLLTTKTEAWLRYLIHAEETDTDVIHSTS